MKRTLNKRQHTELTLEKKILLPLLPGFELAIFRLRVRRSNQQGIQENTKGKNPHTRLRTRMLTQRVDNNWTREDQRCCIQLSAVILLVHEQYVNAEECYI